MNNDCRQQHQQNISNTNKSMNNQQQQTNNAIAGTNQSRNQSMAGAKQRAQAKAASVNGKMGEAAKTINDLKAKAEGLKNKLSGMLSGAGGAMGLLSNPVMSGLMGATSQTPAMGVLGKAGKQAKFNQKMKTTVTHYCDNLAAAKKENNDVNHPEKKSKIKTISQLAGDKPTLAQADRKNSQQNIVNSADKAASARGTGGNAKQY